MAGYSHGLRSRRVAVVLLASLIFLLGFGATGVFAQGPLGTDSTKGPLLRQPETGVAADKTDVEAPLMSVPNVGQVIPGQYIVVFRDDSPARENARAEADRLTAAVGGKLLYAYESALGGFAAQLSDEAVAALRKDPNVAYIEPDQIVGLSDTQTGATWGLDRIDQRNLPLNSTYVYNTTGAGVHAYIVDTGILLNHTQFTGRMGNGYDAVTSGGNANDCNGHGTHVAGTVGGTTYGVAKQVTLHPVRVLSCSGSGSNSGVIAGVDWVRTNHVDPAVANMSLGGGASSALDTAVNNAINAGVTFVVAAGNSNANACNYSPARTAAAITVGATTSTDARASYSNYGSCLDLFAPGSSITSAWYTSTTATNTISGTSMASPHVAGVAALYLQANPSASPTTVRNAIVNGGTTGVVSGAGSGSPNILLYSLLTGGGPSPTVTPPPAPTSTPAPGPTSTPPPSGGNVIVNPGFESGSTGWTQYSSAGYTLITTDRPRTGSYSAWMGGYNNATEYVAQVVTVPSNGVLTYYWRMESSEGTSRAYDTMSVRLDNASTGSTIATLRTWSNTSTRNAWSQDSISLAAYAGQTVRLTFYTRTDYSLATSFFVDDVSLR